MNMSFALTKPQILAQSKSVTRRIGWKKAKVGQIVQPIFKGQGIPKGGKVERLGGPIRFIAVSREVLEDITPADVFREGFPQMTKGAFIKFFKRANGCRRTAIVTRIQFEYLVPIAAGKAGDL
jgi:hypothetical protein